jgi:hypothetical protein
VHAMHKTFGDPIRDLIEVYVDDIVVKIKSHPSLLDNLTIVSTPRGAFKSRGPRGIRVQDPRAHFRSRQPAHH